MYNAEVLSKFPVVQHFPMGSLFVWEKDPASLEVTKNVHTTSQPSNVPIPASRPQPTLRDPLAEPGMQGTRAPCSRGGIPPASGTAAPWASSRGPSSGAPIPSGPNQPTRAPWTSSSPLPRPSGATTTAPWNSRDEAGGAQSSLPSTRAPWVDKKL
jgi:serine/threonine-protein phosphatase 2A activator